MALGSALAAQTPAHFSSPVEPRTPTTLDLTATCRRKNQNTPFGLKSQM